ncbi:uncharacterized protein [Nicotiana tomentosiformis]|uniref:uncharacterized protein n=1 Tax=Nicotiana tomentosiformis TaxID=4098 RepID=UPI00388CDB18
MTVVENEKNELIPTRTVMGWRVYIDYRRLNKATCKDHFPLTFIDQMLGRLAGHEYYTSLMRMPFGPCNAPATFQRCMMAIFTDMVEQFVEVFMDDFSVFGLLEKDVIFNIDEACLKAFEELKKKFVTAAIIVAPDWSLPFELMCDASEHAIGQCLARGRTKCFSPHTMREFDVEVRDRKGTKKQVADHLSRLEVMSTWRKVDKLRRQCADQLMKRCIPEKEVELVLYDYHASPYGGHRGHYRIAAKVLQYGFFWPTLFKDAHAFVKKCDQCHRIGTIKRRHQMPLNNILEVEIFYVWGIDFIGPFPMSRGNKYILLAVDYVSKWEEAIAFPINDAKVVADLLKKNTFSRFGTPRALISDEGTHFCNRLLSNLLTNKRSATDLP